MSTAAIDAEMLSLFTRCLGFDPAAASGAMLDEHAGLLARVASWVDAQRARVGAAKRRLEDAASDASGRGGGPPGAAPKRRRARPAPGPGSGSGAHARRDLDAAEGARRCPSFADALAGGRVSVDHLIAVGRARNASDVATQEVALLAAAVTRSADEFAAWLRGWDDACDAARGADVAARRRTKRRVSFGDDDDGMQFTRAVLGPVEHAEVSQALHDTAEVLWRNGDRSSSLSQRLADALVALVTGRVAVPVAAPATVPADAEGAATADSSPPTAPPGSAPTSSGAPALPLRRPPAPAILAILDDGWLRGEADRVGIATTLDGVPLTPTELRLALCEAEALPIVLGGDGQVIDVGRARRHATDAQWRALLGRDGGCVVLGCRAPAAWAVAHHCRPWGAGGTTDLANLCLLCPTHHRDLHQLGWTARVEGGVVRIVTVAGHHVPTRNRRGPVPVAEATCGGRAA